MVSIYIEFLKKSFKQRFIYKSNTYIYTLSSIIRLVIQISIWYALLDKKATVEGITFHDMVGFVIINTLILSLIDTNMGNRLAEKVSDGSIAVDFIRPIDLKLYLFADQLGENCFRVVFSTLPVCIFSVVILKFHIPDIVNIILFIISATIGIILVYYINYILGLLAFWFKTSFYVEWFQRAFFELFAGTFVPLWFYPSFLYKISMLLPFRLVSFEPISICLGKVSPLAALNIIVFQIIWLTFLIILQRYVWKKAQDKVVIQGG